MFEFPFLMRKKIFEKKNAAISTFALFQQSQLLITPREKPFENIVGKGENAGNQHFLLFPQYCLPSKRQKS